MKKQRYKDVPVKTKRGANKGRTMNAETARKKIDELLAEYFV